jgi:DNA-binding GntR family transcriptional regulator
MSPSRRQSDALRLVIGPALSDRAYTALREAITDGSYPPGTRLTERALSASLGVSPTPVHEALRRLEYERLIERDSVRTIRVADPSTSQLYDLTLIEAALRGVAARLAAERATDAEQNLLLSTCDEAEELLNVPDLDEPAQELHAITRRFRELVNLASRSAHLVDMIATAAAFDAAFRVKRSAPSHCTAASLRAKVQRHCEVAHAIHRRDAATAEQVMREHILERAAAMTQAAEAQPGLAPSADS